MESLFLNLFDNSLYWLLKVDKLKRNIIVEVSKENHNVEVVFSDSGPGIPSDIASKIWEPWFSTRSGTGLGLTIVGEIANEHRADLDLDLERRGPLPGATFRLRFNDVSDAS